MTRPTLNLFDPALLRPALADAFRKLDPRVQWRNPVMFVVYVGSAFTTALAVTRPDRFAIGVALWLWITVLFANMAEALAEGRSRAQAASLRGLKKATWSKRLQGDWQRGVPRTDMAWPRNWTWPGMRCWWKHPACSACPRPGASRRCAC